VRQLPQRRYGAETPAKFDLNNPNREKHGELKITLSFFHYWSPSSKRIKTNNEDSYRSHRHPCDSRGVLPKWLL
jgi:hypothetical protein